jgi:hypothetical protein
MTHRQISAMRHTSWRRIDTNGNHRVVIGDTLRVIQHGTTEEFSDVMTMLIGWGIILINIEVYFHMLPFWQLRSLSLNN